MTATGWASSQSSTPLPSSQVKKDNPVWMVLESIVQDMHNSGHPMPLSTKALADWKNE